MRQLIWQVATFNINKWNNIKYYHWLLLQWSKCSCLYKITTSQFRLYEQRSWSLVSKTMMVSERDTHSITESRHVTWGFLPILCSRVTLGVMDGSSSLPQIFIFRETYPEVCPICSSKSCQLDSQDQQHRNIYKEFSSNHKISWEMLEHFGKRTMTNHIFLIPSLYK